MDETTTEPPHPKTLPPPNEMRTTHIHTNNPHTRSALRHPTQIRAPLHTYIRTYVHTHIQTSKHKCAFSVLRELRSRASRVSLTRSARAIACLCICYDDNDDDREFGFFVCLCVCVMYVRELCLCVCVSVVMWNGNHHQNGSDGVCSAAAASAARKHA